jgi:hypothetical protein
VDAGTPRWHGLQRGDIWTTDAGVRVLVISSTGYNEIPSEPTVIVVPVVDTEPDIGFGVDLGENDWIAPGLVTSLRKVRLSAHHHRIDVHALPQGHCRVRFWAARS